MHLLLELLDEDASPALDEAPAILHCDLDNPRRLSLLALMFGNGLIGELRATGDEPDAVAFIREFAQNTGGASAHQLREDERARVRLYRPGDECYTQPTTPPAYIFIDPVPRPDLPKEASE